MKRIAFSAARVRANTAFSFASSKPLRSTISATNMRTSSRPAKVGAREGLAATLDVLVASAATGFAAPGAPVADDFGAGVSAGLGVVLGAGFVASADVCPTAGAATSAAARAASVARRRGAGNRGGRVIRA